MPWIWTDELAELLLDRGMVERRRVQDWIDRPVGLACPDEFDPISFGLGRLGVTVPNDRGTAGAA